MVSKQKRRQKEEKAQEAEKNEIINIISQLELPLEPNTQVMIQLSTITTMKYAITISHLCF
jgi:hypothetical protein